MYKKLNWLNVENIVDYLTACQMYNIRQQSSPKYMLELFKSSSHTYNTRYNQEAFEISYVQTHGKYAFSYNGVKVWNDLPIELRKCETKHSFKTKCKKVMMQRMENGSKNEFLYY